MTRTAGSPNIPWDAIVAHLKAHAGRWILLPEMASVSERTIDIIRSRRRRALRLDDGVIRVRKRAEVELENGQVIVTLALLYEKKENHAPSSSQSDAGRAEEARTVRRTEVRRRIRTRS